MRRTLVSLGLPFIFLFLFIGLNGAVVQNIPLEETIKIDPAANLQAKPFSLCGTEDGIFLIPDPQSSTIKVFNKEGNFLKFIKELGPGFGSAELIQPIYCCYRREQNLLGVFDYGVKQIFIFKRAGKIDFNLKKNFPCPKGAYDIAFAGNGDLVVSGYITDNEDNPFELYRINIRTGQITYLLPSPQKYNLETTADYIDKYRIKQTIPAVGTQGFIDIRDDNLFFVWEGALRIIKIDLGTKKRVAFDGKKTSDCARPDLPNLADFFKKGDFTKTWEEQKKMAYVRNIFATQDQVFLVFETARNDRTSAFFLQKYSPEGNYQGNFLIPGKPGQPMWLDDENHELYAFSSEESARNNEKFSILKYKLTSKR